MPDLHPTLIALFIVMGTDGDLEDIMRDHPKLASTKYYSPNATFPQDLTRYLQGERWWEALGAL